MADTPPPAADLEAEFPGLPLGEAVFRFLSAALRSGRYRPGDRLREEEVARLLKVSRTPVREAFGRLLAKDLVVPAGPRGLIVRSLDVGETLELYAMREILEGAAARLAAQHISAPEIGVLEEISRAFTAATAADEQARLNREFHAALTRAARNRFLREALEQLQDAIAVLGATTFSLPGRSSTAAQEHAAVLAAIAARDADRAELEARRHISEALRCRLTLMRR